MSARDDFENQIFEDTTAARLATTIDFRPLIDTIILKTSTKIRAEKIYSSETLFCGFTKDSNIPAK